MKKSLVFATTLLVAIIFSSCAPKMMFGVSPITPLAEGFVKITDNKNGNLSLSVKIFNLVQPQRLTPAENVYVVWAKTDRGFAKNLGMIKVSKKLLSKTLKGSFKTIIIEKPYMVFITAEDDGFVKYPGNIVVLRTE